MLKHMSAFYKTLYHTFRKYSTASSKVSYYHGASSKPLISMTFPRAAQDISSRYGDNEAVVDSDQNIRKTFREYISDIKRLANGFLELGLERGDRVGIFAPNCYQWLLVQFAAAYSGLILVAINPTSKPKELEHCLRLTGVRTLIAAEKVRNEYLYPVIRDTVPELGNSQILQKKFPSLENLIMISEKHYDCAWRFNDIASIEDPELEKTLSATKDIVQIHDPVYIIFTSGTTGSPKGCTLSHHSAINMAYFTGHVNQLTKPGTVYCLTTPLFHAMGSNPALTCMLYGQKLVIPSPTYSVTKLLTALSNEQCTFMTGTPTTYIDVLNHPDFNKYQFPALDKVNIGGASASPETIGRIKSELGLSDILVGYGCTECTTAVSRNKPGDPSNAVYTTIGKVQDHIEVKVVDSEGNLVPWGSPGELLVRGYLTMLCYWDDPEKTKESFTADRFYKTGDIVTLQPDGTLSIVGRIKDMILRGGENIYPKEIEDVLVMHPKVMEAHVFGIPDERLGEVVVACVLPKQKEEINVSEVLTFCKNELAPYKVPSYVEIVDTFPRLGSGKVNKTEMRQHIMATRNCPTC